MPPSSDRLQPLEIQTQTLPGYSTGQKGGGGGAGRGGAVKGRDGRNGPSGKCPLLMQEVTLLVSQVLKLERLYIFFIHTVLHFSHHRN